MSDSPRSDTSVCDACSEFHHLLRNLEDHLHSVTEGYDGHEVLIIDKHKLDVFYQYLGIWVQRQCLCIYKSQKIVERFVLAVQGVVSLCVRVLKTIKNCLPIASTSNSSAPSEVNDMKKDIWSHEELERLLQYVAKVFMLQFPLYAGPKQAGLRNEEVSPTDATQMAVYCDVHDSTDFPVALLRNVSFFCKSGGLLSMAKAFLLLPDDLPPSLAHALISILCNVKLWLNYRAVTQLFTPVRSNALRYMCELTDMDLRQQPARHIADFLWSSIKENVDGTPPIAFDRDGLELAFKYFCSSTLTMRLTGITQINSHISLFNEMCNAESVVEVENVGLQLAGWILSQKIVEHIFGPNLHVEVIKQSHVLLNFLAVEGKITNEHVNVIWQASQLKHCSKQVHDLLLPLIKNLEAGPVLHLYDLLKDLPVKEHTEQTIHLAQVLQKFIWTSGGTFSHLLQEASAFQNAEKMAVLAASGAATNFNLGLSSSDMEDADSSTASAPALNPLAATAAVLMASQQHQQQQQQHQKATKANKDLLEKSVATAAVECEFSGGADQFSDDESGDDDDDDDDDDDEEDDDDDEDDDDEEEEDDEIIVKDTSTTTKESSDNEKTEVKKPAEEEEVQTTESSSAAENAANVKEYSGKRTKGLPIKGVKRSRGSTDASVESNEDSIKKAKKEQPNTQAPPVQHPNMNTNPNKSESPFDPRLWWAAASVASSANSEVTDRDTTPLMSPNLWKAGNNSGQSTAMAELANLVNAHPRAGMQAEVHDMRPFLRNLAVQRRWVEDCLSDDNESMSSRMSNKSDKNLGDFDDENSVDEEMLQLAQSLQQQQQLANMANFCHQQRITAPRLTARQQREGARLLSHYKLDLACQPGNTLLWDLLQDDNIEQLAEGLALEAEKALSSLLCLNMDRLIRIKFIEGCVTNIAKNESVAISLRLLPKLFQSFQNFRGMDTHEVSMFAERRHNMMKLFFDNLQVYTEEHKKGKDRPFFNHLAQIQVRLQFLGVIFSSQVSPNEFHLSNDQINILWSCLANDPVCSDDFFQWLLVQVHTKDQHAITIDGFRLIYNEKLPNLRPETISMLGLNLFSQLCQLSRMRRPSTVSSAGVESSSNEENPNANNDTNVKMDQLWKIALCAHNTDVSMKAIQILNSAYFGQGEEFLITCMQSLKKVRDDLGSEEVLTKIQRAVLLLKTYLETFRRKYAYHFRRMSIDGQGVLTHAELVDLKAHGPIRIVVQTAGSPAGLTEKVNFDMQLTDLVADLRAEITAWWENKALLTFAKDKSDLGPLRLITQGQEIGSDVDEKSLVEVGFKDLQLVFISQGARGLGNSNHVVRNIAFPNSELPPFPGKDKMPMNLLLQPLHFEQLFQLMQNLSDLRVNGMPYPKAQILSRRVWDILMLLPTNPTLKEKLQTITAEDESTLQDLLDPASPQKLMYTFYIVDWLGRPARLRRLSGLSDQAAGTGNTTSSTGSASGGADPELASWSTRFAQAGGLKLLFSIFAAGSLQSRDGNVWCEWRQDCLSALLKLLLQFGVHPEDHDALVHELVENPNATKKRHRRGNGRKSSGHSRNNIIVPRLAHNMINLMDGDTVIAKATSVLLEASQFAKDPNAYRTGVFGRSQVVHYAMNLLVSWVFSNEGNEDALFSSVGLLRWLRNLLLDDHDPSVRREACTGLYKLCLGTTLSGARTGSSCTAPLLSVLLEFLDDALVMTPIRREHMSMEQEGKEPYGPACRDYFWIICRLVDNLEDNESNDLVDLDHLARQLACGIVSRKLYEKRHGDSTPDDTLVGALQLLGVVMKQQPPFKSSPEGQDFLLHLLECLFALPSPKEKNLPKCKSAPARTACYDLIVEMTKGSLTNYLTLHKKLLEQHSGSAHKPYPWEHWPKDDGRSECGYVGLTNLGATCYMATCVQQLYMIPDLRDGILTSSVGDGGKHPMTLQELQRMFAYLRDSERKAYNPLSFCKTYEMDHQPLNTGEQKDMAEFFIDLLSKMEDMSPELKTNVKGLFCGTLTNNVVSLDCNHVSKTAEEFYTVRCQVSEMRNLFQSLEEVTVKDTLEGDNMYTCSQCNKKVRAEKRACFQSLPKILAFNTMRYTFNMVTMLKEKVNTHFSFPFQLDMSAYMEHNLIPKDREEMSSEDQKKEEVPIINPSYDYQLIGVTVHTGTADGGHYYAFIRDRYGPNKDKWYSFNDAEVKPFDPNQIAAECFGGEMNSRTYDQVTDKFMDLSIEKTNSAYMLFYERIEAPDKNEGQDQAEAGPSEAAAIVKTPVKLTNPQQPLPHFGLSQALEEWIWEDNMNFIQDNNIFDHNYFNFMWQMVSYVPNTLNPESTEDITLLAVKLATSFFLESFIHAKEKLNIVQWVELLTKQFDSSTAACSWFLNHMAKDNNWPVTIFLKCHVNTIRQMFHRLCIHVIQKLRDMEKGQYLLPWIPDEDLHEYQPDETIRPQIGMASPITGFLRTVLNLLDSGMARGYLKHLTELFRFLYDFAKLGDEEAKFFLSINTITTFVEFYLKAIRQSPEGGHIDLVSDEDDEDDDDIVALTPMTESNRLASLEKMIWLLVILVEKSRGEDNQIHLSNSDLMVLTGKASLVTTSGSPSAAATATTATSSSATAASTTTTATSASSTSPPSTSTATSATTTTHSSNGPPNSKGLVFLYHITKDNINIHQTGNLIFALARNNPDFAEGVAGMVFHGVKQTEYYMNFFRLLTMLTELPGAGGPPGMPCFTSLVMHKVWDLAKTCPQPALDWLSIQVARNRYVQSWLISTMENWVEQYLLAHSNQKVRSSAAFLVVSLVNSSSFRQAFRTTRNVPSMSRESLLGNNREDLDILHQILNFLLGLLPNARLYTDLHTHGTAKLVAYFQTMTHFLLSNNEKLMFEPHFMNLWNLFHPKLSEPGIPVHHNKQALLHFWLSLCMDCPENVRLILSNSTVTKNIAFNYILADHEDSEVVNFNRMMLPTYYGLLKLCCLESQLFRRQLAQHQNIQWAFKNITPYYTQYTLACDELFKLMSLFVKPFTKKTDLNAEKEQKLEMDEIAGFRQQTLQLYLSTLDGRTSWNTLIQVLKILVQTNEDRLYVVFNNGLSLVYEAFNMLQMMFHEATACHVISELSDILSIFSELVKAVRLQNRVTTSNLKTSTSESDSNSPAISAPNAGNTSETSSNSPPSKDWRHLLSRWKDMGDMTTRLLTLCNSYVPAELREICLMCVKEMLMLWPTDMLTLLVPLLHRSHNSSTETSENMTLGPYFPRRNLQPLTNLKTVRPPRPMFQMCVPSSQLEGHNGQDSDYDRALHRYFYPYHQLVDLMVRLAVNEEILTKPLVDLSAMVGLDGVPLHLQLFPKLWLDIFNTKQIDRKIVMMLVTSHGFLEYVDAVLLDERASLNNAHVFNFLLNFFPKVCDQVLTDQVQGIISHLVNNFIDSAGSFNLSSLTALKQLNGDLRALILVSSTRSELLSQNLSVALKTLKSRVGIILASLTSGPSTKENNENSATSVSAKIEEPSGGAAESSENSDKKIEDTTDNNSDNKNSREKDSNSENLINNTPHKKRRLSEEPSSSNSNSNLKSPLTTKGPKDEKSKWKEHLVLFMNTLNLLIGMSENAIAAAESPDNNVSKAASSVEKPEVNKQLTGSASDSDQENIKKDPGSIKEEDNVDESTK